MGIPQCGEPFIPMDIAMLQRVSVLYRDGDWYTAFVDGFCPQSRRHHVNYGDTSEWRWVVESQVKLIDGQILENIEEKRTEIVKSGKFAVPPPFDPMPYGLDDSFVKQSKAKSSKTKSKKKKKKKKIIKLKKTKTTTKKRKRKSFEIESKANNETSPIVPQRKKQIKKQVPIKPPPPSRKKQSNLKYPRHVVLNGVAWKRAHSSEEKKYFWSSQGDNSQVNSSWNPWNEAGKIAPWLDTVKREIGQSLSR